MLNINSPRRRADSLLCRSREEPSTDKICVPMMMIALVLILSFFHPSLSPLFPTSLVSVVNAQKCVSYSFKCCRNVHYSVMDILAETWDRQTCQMIDYELKTKLANYSKACQQAYADSFCLSTIAQCCSAQQPVYYHVCSSVCQNMMAQCGSVFNATACKMSPPFYPPPCNSGYGSACPSSSEKTFSDNNNEEDDN
ncbi:hypothetical protein FDP41_008044 [Naegleria fowleri]|uniref:FZ domain-containing protein n=1 Tax=Naegleria fowleri TaxID=5763 RepID=A0A6A5CFQ2_NAEFO|nr:uncharacterized protein FDP41_008044 [Naegleria fowleri]KAF0984129.1 hypothetical protein FDP41_008044 [Naegleria fowleri]CAG4717123.1 unnamed protein product [Naegleria fowleri]